eukprot:COSAG01_NODE_93_length_27013_cov_41.515791_8_plen_223_part_00
MEGWRSGQSQQTVNLPSLSLRWFESSSLHQNAPMLTSYLTHFNGPFSTIIRASTRHLSFSAALSGQQAKSLIDGEFHLKAPHEIEPILKNLWARLTHDEQQITEKAWLRTSPELIRPHKDETAASIVILSSNYRASLASGAVKTYGFGQRLYIPKGVTHAIKANGPRIIFYGNRHFLSGRQQQNLTALLDQNLDGQAFDYITHIYKDRHQFMQHVTSNPSHV